MAERLLAATHTKETQKDINRLLANVLEHTSNSYTPFKFMLNNFHRCNSHNDCKPQTCNTRISDSYRSIIENFLVCMGAGVYAPAMPFFHSSLLTPHISANVTKVNVVNTTTHTPSTYAWDRNLFGHTLKFSQTKIELSSKCWCRCGQFVCISFYCRCKELYTFAWTWMRMRRDGSLINSLCSRMPSSRLMATLTLWDV